MAGSFIGWLGGRNPNRTSVIKAKQKPRDLLAFPSMNETAGSECLLRGPFEGSIQGALQKDLRFAVSGFPGR